MNDTTWACPNCNALHQVDPQKVVFTHSIRCMRCKHHEPVKNTRFYAEYREAWDSRKTREEQHG